ncbi:hypothetical protein CQ14_18995 [Bradyrhizobium lablabi]|uniref:Uncharacterized protein n=1 Tax=Bradyrhizobium lablabi TaxID=722472 RepID=A0A0R3MLC4_9BRAD|nr:hypothetical protein [Bradyrhizobium lablabi]KRR18975.1 hypothetical protein CQ14_18995 [Bradyrhizobium lablabi]
MDRETFLNRLLQASDQCRNFTAGFVVDLLPNTHLFWVHLNCSYDGNPLEPDEIVFPDDVQRYGSRVGPLEAEDVTSLLWRDRMVPEWIDISVWRSDEQATHFRLECCGRFTSRGELHYYNWTDVAPFGVKGPAYPRRLARAAIDGEAVEKFSLAEINVRN